MPPLDRAQHCQARTQTCLCLHPLGRLHLKRQQDGPLEVRDRRTRPKFRTLEARRSSTSQPSDPRPEHSDANSMPAFVITQLPADACHSRPASTRSRMTTSASPSSNPVIACITRSDTVALSSRSARRNSASYSTERTVSPWNADQWSSGSRRPSALGGLIGEHRRPCVDDLAAARHAAAGHLEAAGESCFQSTSAVRQRDGSDLDPGILLLRAELRKKDRASEWTRKERRKAGDL